MRSPRSLLPLIDAVFCAIVLVLLLADAIWPLANIFLNGFVKLFLLVTCLLSAVCGGMRIADRRRRERNGRRA